MGPFVLDRPPSNLEEKLSSSATMSPSADLAIEHEAGSKNGNCPREWTTTDTLDQYLSLGHNYPLAVAIWVEPNNCGCHMRSPACCAPPACDDLNSPKSPCGGQPELSLPYIILFPFSAHAKAAALGLSFEIDKVTKRFQTVGFDTKEPGGVEIDALTNAFNASAISQNEEEDEDKGLRE